MIYCSHIWVGIQCWMLPLRAKYLLCHLHPYWWFSKIQSQMLHHLQWPSLQSRKSTARLILLFKIVRNLLVLPNRCQSQPTNLYTHANNSLKSAQLQSRVDLYKYSFLPRTIIDWNNLQIDNIDTINLKTFKSTLTNHTWFVLYISVLPLVGFTN